MNLLHINKYLTVTGKDKACLVLCIFFSVFFAARSVAQDGEEIRVSRETGQVIVQFPKNNLGETSFVPKDDDKEQRTLFNKLIGEIAEPYVKLIDENEVFMHDVFVPGKLFPVTFVVDDKSKDWENRDVNANASQTADQLTGKGIWSIQMYGALFRRPEMTLDGFALVVCHEIGHHFSGFPFHIEGFSGAAYGHAAEGQADYFASHYCLRNHWRNDANTPPYAGPNGTVFLQDNLPIKVQEECRRKWSSDADRMLCQRIAVAGYSVATLWGAMDQDRNECENKEYPQPCYPQFDKPDPTFADPTNLTHPRAQCRLDTYFYGALCAQDFGPFNRLTQIPGKFAWIPENTRRARVASEKISCPISAGDTRAIRPFCWYNPAWPKE